MHLQFIINLLSLSKRKKIWYNIMKATLSLGRLKVHGILFIKNLAQYPILIEEGLENFSFFYKIPKALLLSYLPSHLNYFGTRDNHTRSVNQNNTKTFSARTKITESSLFPYIVKEQVKLSEKIRNTKSVSEFKKAILGLCRPKRNSVFSVCDFNGIKLLSLNLNHINENLFQYNFNDTIDPVHSCGLWPDTIFHQSLRYNLCTTLKVELFMTYVLMRHLLKVTLIITC